MVPTILMVFHKVARCKVLTPQKMEEGGAQLNKSSSTESFLNAQPKMTDIDGRTSLVSSKTLRTPGMKKPVAVDIQPSHNKQKAQGK